MNYRTQQLIRLLPFFLLLTLIASPAVALAQASRSFYYDSFDVDIRLNQDGTLDVTEQQTVVFEGGTFSFGYAVIPYNRLDDIRNISVREGDTVYIENSGEAPLSYSVERNRNDVTINWFFPPTTGRHTYTFSYTVDGAVRVEDNGSQIFWTAIPGDVPGRVNESQVTISVPPGVTIGSTEARINGNAANGVEVTVSEDGQRAVFDLTGQPLFPGDTFEAGVRYPTEQLALAVPQWQLREARADTVGLVVLIVALALLIGVPLFVLFIWYTRGRDPEVGVVADMLAEPPDDLPPAFVGSLLDERVDLRDIVSTLVDLARRGYIEIREESNDHEYVRTEKSFGDLRPYEQTIAQAFFGSQQSRKLSSLKYKFAQKLPGLQSAIYKAMVEADMFRQSPQTIRNVYRGLGAAVGVLGVVAVFLLAGLDAVLPFGLCLGLALIPGALALLYAATHMPRKTPHGAEVAARWRAFQRYFKDIEKYTTLEEAKARFDHFLPYAVAFGMERSWINKFKSLDDVPAPPWYYPYPRGPVYRPVILGGGGGGARPAGGAPQMPTLEGMSDSLSGGLQGMSDGLTRMLNSTSTVLRSEPPSTSSRSSGSFGGGFSGGFSGGSSGGGSRGFG